MLTEAEREAIVRSGAIYLKDGLRATLVGWKDPHMCGVHSARPGFWQISWETAQRIVERPNRRMDRLDNMFRSGGGWLGFTPNAADFQTREDYEQAKRSGMDVI